MSGGRPPSRRFAGYSRGGWPLALGSAAVLVTGYYLFKSGGDPKDAMKAAERELELLLIPRYNYFISICSCSPPFTMQVMPPLTVPV